MQIRIKKGFDLPISGTPEQVIEPAAEPATVAVLGGDYPGLRPSLLVQVGDSVKLGQALLVDKRNPSVNITAPGAGEVVAINRGARRALQSVVIRLQGEEAEQFTAYPREGLAGLNREQVRDNLLRSGLWTALRRRPFSRVPDPDAEPRALFVTAIDSAPLAADPRVVIEAAGTDFQAGLEVLGVLLEGPVYVCTRPGFTPPMPAGERFRQATFAGPHPAGLVGTHIHFIDPVNERKSVWHVGYQDVIAIGRLFVSGRLDPERIVSLGGALVHRPRLLRTRLGASTEDLVRGESENVPSRIVSGSPLDGRRASDWAAYLGRYHLQVSVLAEPREREFLGWIVPWGEKLSLTRAFVASLRRGHRFALDTSQNGSPRAMVPIGVYEQVMPLDILPTLLLRALLVRDTELAQKLGCLELDEEDLALCTFVCPSKYEYGPILRANLEQIEKEG